MEDERMSDDEMLEGYRDGFNDDRPEFPESLSNRGASYRHGWLNGRDDRVGKCRSTAPHLRELAQQAIEKDASR
jgi:hypothetical protein